MTNYESIDPDSVKEVFAKTFAINKHTLEITACAGMNCSNCFFNKSCGESCTEKRKKWLDRPVLDPEKDIDWSKVSVDTPVIVWNTDEEYRRYFSGIKDGRFSAYSDGRTSWSSITGNTCYWNHCKLYRSEDIERYRKKETGNE